MYTDNNYNDSRFTVRSLLVKIFIILTIIIVLIWIVPKFLSYKKGPKNEAKESKTAVVTTKKISSSSLRKLETAGLKYFKSDNIPGEETKSVKVSLKQLQEQKLVSTIKSNSDTCDIDNSYVMLTKNKEDYTMKSYLKCGNSKDYTITNIGEYDYCGTNLLCKKNESIKTDDNKDDNQKNTTDDNNNTNGNTNPNGNSEKTLSEFGPWENYVKASCDTQAVTCDANDVNCLQEVKIYTRKEIVGTKTTNSTFQHTALKYLNTKTEETCSGYNYYVISNVIFRTKGNYGEILQLNKTSTSSWTYNGQVSSTSSPRFGDNEYYKYTGTEGYTHYYDYYKYNYPMERVNSLTESCSSKSTNSVNYYSVYKQSEEFSIKENVYATACYKSVRNRTYK